MANKGCRASLSACCVSSAAVVSVVLSLATVGVSAPAGPAPAAPTPASAPASARPAPAAPARPGGAESFESPDLPRGWLADGRGELALTPERYKSGSQSLRWTWRQGGAALTAAAPAPTPMAPGRSLALWLYNETPRPQVLRMELLRGGSVIGRCWYVLNFKGWRPIGAPYAQLCDLPAPANPPPAPAPRRRPGRTTTAPAATAPAATAPARPAPPALIDGFRLIAPDGPPAADGAAPQRLYLDYVHFACADPLRADHQQPWAGRSDILAADPHKFIYSVADLSLNRPYLPPLVPAGRITPEQHRDMETILARCVSGEKAFAIGPVIPALYPPRRDESVLTDLETMYRIRRSPAGVLTGRPVGPPPQLRGYNVPPDAAVLHLIDPRDAAKHPEASMMIRLVSAYLGECQPSGRPARADAVRRAFLDLCEHLLDQGFAEGNANCASWIFEHRMVFAMRKELGEAGLLRDMLLAAIACATSYGDGVLAIQDWRQQNIQGDPRNTDGFKNYPELLALAVLLPDPSERLQRLAAFSRAVSLLCDGQLGEPYAWDGTAHHHALFHPAYTYGALAPTAFALRGTGFRLSEQALATLKRGYQAIAFMAGPRGIIPPNGPGYAGQPLGLYSDYGVDEAGPPTLLTHRTSALLAACCDMPGSRNGIDADLAGIYLAFHEGNPKLPPKARELLGAGFAPYRPAGHLTLNGASISMHRRDDWLVCIAGQNRFRRSLEANGTYCASSYNHTVRNGSVFVVSRGSPPCPFSSGFSLEGWDSRHIPGTTGYVGQSPAVWFDTRLRPGGPLKDPLAFWGRTGMNESPFGGGTDLDGDGVWGMEFVHDHPEFADNLVFRRSAFCFGNRVTLLTTGIGRTDRASAGERGLGIATTLWQNAFGSGGRLIDRRGKERHLAMGWNVPLRPAPTPPEQEPCWVEGQCVRDFPWTRTLPPGTNRWLIDNKGTGYYVHADNPPLHLARRTQTWTFTGAGYARDPEETRGNFALAWFDHGSGPQRDRCTYTLIPNATPDAMAAFTAAMSSPARAHYRILQSDSDAHVLWDRQSETTGYVVFSKDWKPAGQAAPSAGRAGERRPASDLLLAVNRPCTVMVKSAGDKLRLSVASTDMDFWLREIVLSGEIVLTLQGRWRLSDPDAAATGAAASHQAGDTTLRIPYRTFMPVIVEAAPSK